MSRNYRPLWDSLKKKGHVQIEYPRKFHERVMRALRKESDFDGAFRFECVENEKHYEIEFSQLDDMLLISLKWIPGIKEGFIISPERIKRRQSWQKPAEKRDAKPEDFEL